MNSKSLSIWRRIGVLILGFLLVLLQSVFNASFGFFSSVPFNRWGAIILGIVLSAVIIFVVYKIYQKASDHSLEWLDGKNAARLLLFLGAILIMTQLGTMLMERIYQTDTTANDQLLLDILTNLDVPGKISYVLSTVIFAPVIEEFFFRGIMGDVVFKGLNEWLVILLSSLFFSVMHLSNNPISFIIYAGMGVILHLAYNRRHNVMDSIWVHLLNNAIAVIGQFIMLYN